MVDYLECYVKGIPPVSRAKFYKRFGIESRRGKVTPESITKVNNLLNSGKTLAEVSLEVGLSVASCQKIKSGFFNN